MPAPRRRRIASIVVLTTAALICASMLAPAFGAPKAVSAASLAKKLSRTLTIAKRADRNAKRAIAGLQHAGAQGPAGPAGPKGDKGDPGTAANVGATGPQGPAGPAGPRGLKGDKGDACLASDPACRGPEGPEGAKGDKGDACLSSDPACRGPQGPPGSNGTDGSDGAQGPPGPSATWLNVSIPNSTSTDRAVPGWTLRFQCSGPPTHRLFHIAVPVGGGSIQLSGIKSIDDQPGTTIPFVTGSGTPNTGIVAAIGVNHPNPNNTQGHFYRMNGSFVLHDGLGSTTVTYDMFLENRGDAGTCHFRGTAVQSGLIR
jgi:hypothetical protein